MRAAARIVAKAKYFHGNTAASASNLSFQALQHKGQKGTGPWDASFCSWIFPLTHCLCLHHVSVELKELKHHYTFNIEIKPNLPSESFSDFCASRGTVHLFSA